MNFTRALVRPPSSSFAQGLTAAGLGPPELSRALAQHDAYCAELESCGLRLIRLPADDAFPDGPFVEDAAIVTSRGAVVARPGAAVRRAEVASVRAALERETEILGTIVEPGTLDGGDICEAGGSFLIGLSERTNQEGARQLGRLLEEHGFPSRVVDLRGARGLLHLKSGLAWLGGRRFAAVRELALRPELAGSDFVIVEDHEAYAANCIVVNGRLLLPGGFPRFARDAAVAGHAIVPVAMSEYRKMDGGLSCLSIRF